MSALFPAGVGATEKNGFVLDDALIPAGSVLSGGPPRDGIPAIDRPRFIAATDADFMQGDDRVMGVDYLGMTRAYPVKILTRHEIVNDIYDTEAVVITYCPLCGSGMVFKGTVDARPLTFGVSGLLYNSDVLLYDRQTGSLWSQIMKRAISGPMKGVWLEQIPTFNTTWSDWLERNPDTEVLSVQTGYTGANYDHDPYQDYRRNNRVWFPLTHEDRRLPRKDWVLGVTVGSAHKAYPLKSLQRASLPIRDSIGGTPVLIEFSEEHHSALARDESGEILDAIQLYWFAWAAFHPDTALFEPD